MARQKSRNLWNDGAGTKSVNRPQQVTVAKGWKVTPDLLPVKPLAPRRRKYAPIRPNNRDAVAIPLGGQSYNPLDEEHQEALAKAVRQLNKKKRKDEKFVKMMTMGRGKNYTGNFSADRTWEEEVQETAPATAKTPKKQNTKTAPASTGASSSAASSAPSPVTQNGNGAKHEKVAAAPAAVAKNGKTAKKQKKTKKATAEEAKRAMTHRRHPKRDVVAKETDELDVLLAAHKTTACKREAARQKRRAAKKANLAIKHYGRHYHTPLVLDVTPSDKLVGSLRHLSGGYVHPALERMKSLEERNLVPARMRHTYNKRKLLKPKGEVRVKREEFGVMPETSF
ncbi:Nop53 (60S ribosomal biogenesis), putative [Leishmania donovani]|uniref:Ribosome biogenesis protein NOP53 n=1 Tax=Leishmania donovani TaxID=5661 RepID=A0A3Q8IF61_LEIDO|nr:Nop53 (60S ribosomal biogenesis), putative [Leishmania donovani]